mgnify:FL=1
MSDNYPLFVSSIPAESGYLRVPKSNNNRNMKQIICILALLLMSVTTTKAQTSPATPSIRGKILTEEKQPIKFANIALLSEDSTFIQGTCSRSDGSLNFSLPLPETIYYKFLPSVTKPFASLAPPGVPTTGYCKSMPCYLRKPSSPPPAPFSD